LDTFYKMFDNNPALMAVSSLTDKRFVKINEAFLEKLGYSSEEIIGRTSEELDLFVDPEKQQYVSNLLAKHGRIKNVELEVRGKDGTIITGLFSGEIIDNQKEKSFLTVMTDITPQKRAKKELQEKIDTLQRYKKVTVDRELKMVELKKENKKLKKELNESGH
jgi:PAS domain S-box-containing protein